jgi:hypothetical protein
MLSKTSSIMLPKTSSIMLPKSKNIVETLDISSHLSARIQLTELIEQFDKTKNFKIEHVNNHFLFLKNNVSISDKNNKKYINYMTSLKLLAEKNKEIYKKIQILKNRKSIILYNLTFVLPNQQSYEFVAE